MKRSRGMGLLVMFGIMSVFLTAVVLTNQYLNRAVSQVERHKRERAAEAMAESGLEYARSQIRRKRWLTARYFRSPALGPAQSFEVVVSPVTSDRWSINAVGYCGSTTHKLEGRFP